MHSIHNGKANYQKNIETVGGELILFEDRLTFSPHTFNLQQSELDLLLSSIVSVQKGWTMFLGVLPLWPNAILVQTKDTLFRFTVNGRDLWMSKIQISTEDLEKK